MTTEDINDVLEDNLTISVEEAAVLLNMSRNGAYSAVHEGRIPSLRFGRKIRIPTIPLKKMLGLIEQPRTIDDNAIARENLQQAFKRIDKAIDAIQLARSEAQTALERLSYLANRGHEHD